MTEPEKRPSSLVPLIIAITIVSLVVFFLNETQPWREIGLQVEGKMAGQPVEFLLDDLNMVLMFLALAGLIIFLFVRAARKDRNRDKDKE